MRTVIFIGLIAIADAISQDPFDIYMWMLIVCMALCMDWLEFFKNQDKKD